MHSQNMLRDSLAVHRIFGTREPKHYTTTGPENHRTRGPEDHRTRGPKDQRTTGPEDHRTRGPNNQRTRGPKDQTTRGPQGQGSLNFFSRGCKYFFQGTWIFLPGNVIFFSSIIPEKNHLPKWRSFNGWLNSPEIFFAQKYTSWSKYMDMSPKR